MPYVPPSRTEIIRVLKRCDHGDGDCYDPEHWIALSDIAHLFGLKEAEG
eukprot:gene32355-38196_t